MNYAAAVGAQNGKIGGNIVDHRHPCLEYANRFEMMRLNKALADHSIAFGKI